MNKGLLSIFSTILLFTAGCNVSSQTGADNNEIKSEHQYTITDFADQTITFDATPKRIAALSNGDMDIIYALGGEVVGRPNGKTVIEAAEKTEQIGSTHEIDLEKLTLVQPDIVLGNSKLNTQHVPIIQGLGAQMVLTNANSVKDIHSQIELFGEMLQKQTEADNIISSIQKKVDDIKSKAPIDKVRALLVYGAPGTYMAALPNSLSGDLLEIAGGQNIASDFPSLETYPQYAQLNVEQIVKANPQYILIMSHGGNSDEIKKGFMKEMEQNPAWNKIDAVKEGHIEVLPSDLFGTNPGTRVIEALDLLVTIFEVVNDES